MGKKKAVKVPSYLVELTKAELETLIITVYARMDQLNQEKYTLKNTAEFNKLNQLLRKL